MRSDAIKKGLARAPHRSLLKADGLTDEELERPLIAVISSQNEQPGFFHIQDRFRDPSHIISAEPVICNLNLKI